MFYFLRRQKRIATKRFDALVGGALVTVAELEEVARRGRALLRSSPQEGITETDIERLLQELVAARDKVQAEIRDETAKSTKQGDKQLDRSSYERFVTPIVQMVDTPQAIIDLTILAAKRGAKNTNLLYQLMIAEIDVALARWYVFEFSDFKARSAR